MKTAEGARVEESKCLLAGQFAVETAQRDRERLQRAQRISVVHGEHVLGYSTKLHHDVVTVRVVYYLKILHARLSHPAVEVQHVRLRVVVPYRRFVVQLYQIVHVFGLEPLEQRLRVVRRRYNHPLTVQGHPRQ